MKELNFFVILTRYEYIINLNSYITMQARRQEPSYSQYLNCFLCQRTCQLPRMCPKCSKTFCEQCLQQTCNTIRPQCPSCSSRIRFQEFLNPQVVISMANSLADKIKREMRRNQDRQLCSNHELPLSYFCVQCNQPLCADCGMLTTKHVGHKFVSYRDIYERIKRKIQAEFPKFQRRLAVLQDRKVILQTKLIKLQGEYRRYKKYFQQSWVAYSQKLEKAAKEKFQVVLAKESANAQRLQQLEILRDSIYESMQSKTHLSLIQQANTFTQHINTLSCQQPCLLHSQIAFQDDELVQLIPQYATWQYTLTDFSVKNGIIYSEPKSINGVEWRLKIYPKGNGLARQKFLSVFVQMSKGFTGQNRYQYKIELINPVNPSLTVRRQYCSTFEIGQCWGYNQFQPLQHLAVKEYLLNDSLIFQVGIRNRTYRALVNQQQEYINTLKKQLVQKQKSQMDTRSKRLRINMKESSCSKQKSSQRQKIEQKHEYVLEQQTLQRIKQFMMK